MISLSLSPRFSVEFCITLWCVCHVCSVDISEQLIGNKSEQAKI